MTKKGFTSKFKARKFKHGEGFAKRARRVLALAFVMFLALAGFLLLDSRAAKKEMLSVCAMAVPGSTPMRLIAGLKEQGYAPITVGDGRFQRTQVRSKRGFGKYHCNISHNGSSVIKSSVNFTE